MVEIKSLELKTNLQGILSKRIEEITKEDLKQIQIIKLDYFEDFLIDDLSLFSNLKKCILKNYRLCQKDIEILENLSKLETLELINCHFNDKCKLDLRKLKLSFCENIAIGEVFRQSNINEIYLDNCNKIMLINLDKINKLNQITLNEMNITRKMAIDLNNSLIKNIYFNNCNVNLLAKKKLRSLAKNKCIKQENKSFSS